MTWAKFGVEFFDQLADAGLSDAAVRTHTEALHYLYRLEDMDMRIAKHLVRRFAGSAEWEQATKDLVAAKLWRDDGDAFVVEHHAEVFRSSLAVQLKHRDTERERQRRKRARDGADVGPNVGSNVGATQTDRHTDIQTPLREATNEDVVDDASACPTWGCSQPEGHEGRCDQNPKAGEECQVCHHSVTSIGHLENCERSS